VCVCVCVSRRAIVGVWMPFWWYNSSSGVNGLCVVWFVVRVVPWCLLQRLRDMLDPANSIHRALQELEATAGREQPLVDRFCRRARTAFKSIDLFCEPRTQRLLDESRPMREQCERDLPEELRKWPRFFEMQLPHADLGRVVEARRSDSWSHKVSQSHRPFVRACMRPPFSSASQLKRPAFSLACAGCWLLVVGCWLLVVVVNNAMCDLCLVLFVLFAAAD